MHKSSLKMCFIPALSSWCFPLMSQSSNFNIHLLLLPIPQTLLSVFENYTHSIPFSFWLGKMFTCLLLMGLSQCLTAILCPPPPPCHIPSRTVKSCQRHILFCPPLSFHLLITFSTQYRNLSPLLLLSSICASSLSCTLFCSLASPFPVYDGTHIYHRWQWVKKYPPSPLLQFLFLFKIPSFIPSRLFQLCHESRESVTPWQGVKSSHAPQTSHIIHRVTHVSVQRARVAHLFLG